MTTIRNPSSLFSGLLAAACSFCLLLATLPISAAEQVKINGPAPDFTLPTLDGKDLSLSSLKGKVILVVFWSIYCHVCRQEMPKLNEIYKKYKDQGLEVIAAAIDREPEGTIRDVVKKDGLSFPILLDNEKKGMRAYQARTLPTTFILNRKGIILEKKVGLYEWSSPESQQFIEKLLKGR